MEHKSMDSNNIEAFSGDTDDQIPVSYSIAVKELEEKEQERIDLQSEISSCSEKRNNLLKEYADLHNLYKRKQQEKLLVRKLEAVFGTMIYIDSDSNPAHKVLNKLYDLANKTTVTPDDAVMFIKEHIPPGGTDPRTLTLEDFLDDGADEEPRIMDETSSESGSEIQMDGTAGEDLDNSDKF